jgi:hypothetical protein
LNESFSASEDGGLAIYVDAETLSSVGSRIDIEAEVSYKGIASPVTAGLTMPVSDAGAFPTLRQFGGEIGSVGGLTQEYDPESENYIQRTGGGSVFRSDIPNGMSADRPVAFYYPQSMTFELFRNGSRILYSSGETISQPGKYSIRGRGADEEPNSDAIDAMPLLPGSPSSGEGETADPEDSDVPEEEETVAMSLSPRVKAAADSLGGSFRFDFEILGNEVAGPLYYNAPPGYAISYVILEGSEQDPISGSCAQLLEEGGYELTLSDLSGAAPELTVSFTLRNAAPVLRLSGVTNGMTAHGRVELMPSSDTVRITVLRGGEPYELVNDAILMPGEFTVTAENAAGGFAQYSFTIAYFGSLGAIVIFAAALACLIFLLMRARSRMRVR